MYYSYYFQGFKPCYKWITFNTEEANKKDGLDTESLVVLNLVINGLPSIQ